MAHDDVAALLDDNLRALRDVAGVVGQLGPAVRQATQLIGDSLTTGGKLLCCGNGGSACDAAHFSAEIAGRYVIERPGFPAIDLTADHSIFTALINAYPPHEVFARQVAAQGSRGDVLAAFTTSGNSANVEAAIRQAKAIGIQSIAFLGKGGGQCKGLADVELIVPSEVTARVQEMHLLLYHTICEALDPLLAEHARDRG